MKPLRDLLDKQAEHFEEGGKLEKLYPFYEAGDTFLYTPGEVTQADAHVRDGMDLKRMMITVVLSLQPCILFALYNTGLQASLAYQNIGAIGTGDWHVWLAQALGLSFLPSDIISCFAIGAIYFVPVQLVTIAAGGLCEAIFAVIRKHEINEGFLVTSTLFPLTMPPLIPLWQVAIGIIFGVVIGKEIFGGVGMNFLNPALTGPRISLFCLSRANLGRCGLDRRRWIQPGNAPGGVCRYPYPDGLHMVGIIYRSNSRVHGRNFNPLLFIGRRRFDINPRWLVANHGRCNHRHDCICIIF